MTITRQILVAVHRPGMVGVGPVPSISGSFLSSREARWLRDAEGEEGHVVQVAAAGTGYLGGVYLNDDHFGEELDRGG